MTRKEESISHYKPIKTDKASDIIVKEIWKLITSGILKPGDKLPPERELRKEFDVSLVTLREALQKLEAYGHITKKRGAEGGSFVLDITSSTGIDFLFNYLRAKKVSLEELHHVRMMLDPMLAELCAQIATQEDKNRLSALVSHHKKDFEERGTSKCGWEFYLLLAKISKNKIYIVIQELLIRLLLGFEFSISISDLESTEDQIPYNEETLQAHTKITDAIIAGNPEVAREEMVRHRTVWYDQLKDLDKRFKKKKK